MKFCLLTLFLLPLATAFTFGSVLDVASGNHHTFWLEDGVVFSTGQDLHKPINREGEYIGGKLGRPIDGFTLKPEEASSILAQANYNPTVAPVSGLEGLEIVKIASGQNDGAAITSDGKLYMWGPNDHGQLGLGDRKQRRKAVLVELPSSEKVVDVSIGGAHTLILTRSGKVYATGNNKLGTLGVGDPERLLVPTLVTSLESEFIVQVVAAQNTHSLFLSQDGTVYGCGKNVDFVLGDDLPLSKIVNLPEVIDVPSKITRIAAGVKNSFALDENGFLYGWGDGSKGHFARMTETGDADLSNLSEPTRIVPTIGRLVDIAAGSRHVAVIDSDGQILTWGIHAAISGQLGIGKPAAIKPGELAGTIYSRPQRVILPEGEKAEKIESVANNNFVITNNGSLYGWGQAAHGRLGRRLESLNEIQLSSGKSVFIAYEPILISYRFAPQFPDTGKLSD
ncbi:MAG: hypothetical protein AAF546_04865 [Verrucomicrobiota bacterium]